MTTMNQITCQQPKTPETITAWSIGPACDLAALQRHMAQQCSRPWVEPVPSKQP